MMHLNQIYYRAAGTGPVLVMLQGGASDADGTADLAALLADRYTVITYDRRGLSRSGDVDTARVSVETHAYDVVSVLRAVTDEPAYLVGTSLGAVIGLEVLVREPRLVRRLVAHEPPVLGLLPPAERGAAEYLYHRVLAVHRSDGPRAAIGLMMDSLKLDPADREPGTRPPVPSSWQASNLATYLDHDLPALLRHAPDLSAYQAQADKLVPMTGVTSGPIVPRRCAEELARLAGVPLAAVPGGHGGFLSHPRAVSERLGQLMAD